MSDPALVSDVKVPASSAKRSPHFSTTILLAMLFLSSIAIGGTAYYFFAEASGTTTANAGSLDLADTTVVDLGTLWAQDHYRVEIPVKNTGMAELKLVKFSTSCTCTAIDPESLAIPAGSTGTFHAELDLVSRGTQDYQLPMRTTEVLIVAQASGERPPKLSWKLRATVRNAIGLNPSVVLKAPMVIGADAPSQSVQIVEHIPLQKLIASCDPARAEVGVARTASDGGSSKLNIRLKSHETPGAFEFPIILTPVAAENGATIPSVKIHVQGRVVEDIYATPSSFAGGMLRDGQHLKGNIVLASRQQHPFEIKKIEPSDPSIQAALVASSRPTESKRIRITSGSLPVGKITASITIFAFDKTTERQMRIVVPVTGFVVPPTGSDKEKGEVVKFEAGVIGKEPEDGK